ncbi:Nn.00g083810.m01.CDS01 [Neocucurbitaria sp. VM-36]
MTPDPTQNRVFTFHHAELGPMSGFVKPNNVVQFRGIPFASIPGRFKQSILLDSLAHTTRDFTKFSYACPQTFPDNSAGGGTLPGDVNPPASNEFECLNLQLNVPLACLESSSPLSKLPVLIYIHGGGFVLGKIDEQHNTALMAEQSLLDSQPVISASIQYRLGALGYLHTPESGHENRALHDQRNALLWFQKFVAGFGGDPGRVTVFGESAGSMSICAHLLSRPPASGPLFTRTILMSGIPGPMTAPVSVEEAKAAYEKFLTILAIEERGEAGMSKLRELDIQDIVDATAELNNAGSMWLPVKESDFFIDEAQALTWDALPAALSQCPWVEAIVLGTTSFEGTTLVDRISSVTPQAFIEGVTEKLGEDSASLVSKAYEITSDMDQSLFTTQALRWIGDVIFDGPIHALARNLTTASDKKIYRYVFDVRNPFPNQPLYQQPHHWVDIYYVFKVHQFRYSSRRLKDISTRHAQLWVDFANGNTPWKEYKYTGNGDEVIMVADERDGWIEKTVAENEKVLEYSWRRCESLWESWKEEKGKSFLPLNIAPLEGKKLT